MSLESNSAEYEGPGDSTPGRAEEASTEDEIRLNEDEVLAALQATDVTAQQISEVSKSAIAAKSRKVALAIATHARTPRHISVPMLRRMFTFDLMHFSLMPAVAADVKRVAEEQILLRVESLTAGEKISLAKRASGRVAAALLQVNDARVVTPALDNSQMTEPLVVQALMKPRAPERLFVLVSGHQKWPQRREVQIALLRSEKTPLERVREFSKNFPREFLCDLVPDSRKSEFD